VWHGECPVTLRSHAFRQPWTASGVFLNCVAEVHNLYGILFRPIRCSLYIVLFAGLHRYCSPFFQGWRICYGLAYISAILPPPFRHLILRYCIKYCVMMYSRKALNPIQTWIPGLSDLYCYAKFGMASIRHAFPPLPPHLYALQEIWNLRCNWGACG
jgi:hypothetical protein